MRTLNIKIKHVGVSLGAYEEQVKLAYRNLGKLMDDLDQGRVPNGTRKKIMFLKPEKLFKGDLIGIRKNYISPARKNWGTESQQNPLH